MGVLQDENSVLDSFKTLIYDNAVEAALQSIPYAGAVFKVPFLGPFLIAAIQFFITTPVYTKLKGVVNFGTILFVDVAHRQAFDSADTSLKLIALSKGVTSPEYIAQHAIEKAALKKMGQYSVAQPGITS